MSRFTLSALLAAGVLLAPNALAQPSAPASSPSTATAPAARIPDTLFTQVRPAVFKLENVGGGHGTGFFIDAHGLALTAYHVVYGARELSARTLDGKTFQLDVVGYDETHDIALLRARVEGPVPFLPLALRVPRVGDAVLAVGNSGREFLDDERGVLRALDVKAGRADFPSGTLELDAPLRPGDSGGPIISATGEAVGVTSYIRMAPNEEFRSYAVPVTRTSTLVREMRAGMKRDAPVIGIRNILELNDEVARETGLGEGGVVFQELAKGGPAELAGLRALQQLTAPTAERRYGTLQGDVIVAVNGERVRDVAGLMAAVRAHRVGDTVQLSVRRGGEVVQLEVKLGGSAQVFTPRG